MKTLTVEQIRECDRRATREYGIPSLILMENAGRGLAKTIQEVLQKQPNTTQVLFFCGGGNNAGDAFVAARHLYQKKIQSKIYLIGSDNLFKGDAKINFDITRKLGIPCFPFPTFKTDIQTNLRHIPLVIVDALLGTGFKPPLKDPFKDAIGLMNSLKKSHNAKVTTVAVDIPSGLSGNEGQQGDVVVGADLTVSFGARKKGLEHPSSRRVVGKIEVVDIGIPPELIEKVLK